MANDSTLRAGSLAAAGLLCGLAGFALLSLRVSWRSEAPAPLPPSVRVERLEAPKPPEPKPEPAKPRASARVTPSPVPLPAPDVLTDIEPGPVVELAPAATNPGPAAPPAPGPRQITNARWLERPDGSTFSRYYPERALTRSRAGKVVLDCLVGADGRIACEVVSEDPRGWGFGPAALQISKSFRMAPQLEDGQPTEGGRVRVPLRFNPG